MGAVRVVNRHLNERLAQRTSHRPTSRTLYGTSLTYQERSIKNELIDGYQRGILQKQGTILNDEKQCCKNLK
jgi:hypothetical protein